MSRSDKLYRRVDELETEYRRLLGREFRKHLEVGWSGILPQVLHPILRKCGFVEEIDHIYWLAKEIESLREKLGEPIEDGPVADVQRLSEVVSVRFYTDAEMRPLIREIVHRWSGVHATQD